MTRFEQKRDIPERDLNEHIKKSTNKALVTQSGDLNDMIAAELDKEE